SEDPRDLAVAGAWDIKWAGHLEISGAQGLDDLPSFVEYLYEAPVVRHWADDGVFLLVKPDFVGTPLHTGDNRDPWCLRSGQRRRTHVNARADPLVTVCGSEKELGFPETSDALRETQQGTGAHECLAYRSQVFSEAYPAAVLA